MITVVVAGTGTAVGKTWWAAAIARALAGASIRVAARKPVLSYDPTDPGPTDADVLAAATGEPASTVCPPHRRYARAMAPPMAADALARPAFTLDELLAEIAWPPDAQVGLVETAGGVRSPLAHDGDTVDLLGRLRPDLVLLVGDAGLGTINAIRLAADALAGWPVVVGMNRFDHREELHRRNRDWLARAGFDVAVDAAAVAGRIRAACSPGAR